MAPAKPWLISRGIQLVQRREEPCIAVFLALAYNQNNSGVIASTLFGDGRFCT